MAGQDEKYLTVKEAAALLRVHPVTMSEWCRTGKIRAMKVGVRWRILSSDLTRTVSSPGSAEEYQEHLRKWIADFKAKSPNNPVVEWFEEAIEAAYDSYVNGEGEG